MISVTWSKEKPKYFTLSHQLNFFLFILFFFFFLFIFLKNIHNTSVQFEVKEYGKNILKYLLGSSVFFMLIDMHTSLIS